ncbi:MAG: hypothetical protein H5T65_10655 [Chloroflexi bacterium]|nr:hypothetical protein [Chloroflexota bacterium]
MKRTLLVLLLLNLILSAYAPASAPTSIPTPRAPTWKVAPSPGATRSVSPAMAVCPPA